MNNSELISLITWQHDALKALNEVMEYVLHGKFESPADFAIALGEVSDQILQEYGAIVSNDDPLNFMSPDESE